MALRIFYFTLGLFVLGLVYVLSNNYYSFDDKLPKTKIANVLISDVVDYELDLNSTKSKIIAKKIIRYSNYDEAYDFNASFIRNNSNEMLSAQKAIIEGDLITLQKKANYKNLDNNIDFLSDFVTYDKKFLISKTPFRLTQNDNLIIGLDAKYDIKNEKLYAKKVEAWYMLKE